MKNYQFVKIFHSLLVIMIIASISCNFNPPEKKKDPPKNNEANVIITVNNGTTAIIGASVTVGEMTATTDSSGKASFVNVSAGTYTVSVTAVSYENGTKSITVTKGIKTTATVSLSQQKGNATITINDGANPINGAQVTMNGTTLTADSSGQVTFSDVPANTYTVTASAANFNNGTGSVTITGGTTVSSTISLAKQSGNAIITVNNGTGAITGATVVLNGQTVTTNDQGQASFVNIPIGSYTANISATGYKNGSACIVITNGNTASVSVTLEKKTGNATITVNNGTSPIQNAGVTLNGNTSYTDDAGKVTFTNVPVDTYTVTAIATDYNGGSASITIIADTTVSASITLAKQTGNATIAVNNGTNAISGATVVLNGQTATTDSQGQASFVNIPVGQYTANISATGYKNGSANITITNGNTVSTAITLVKQTGNATITVNNGTSPIQNASVTLNGSTSYTDDTGKVTFSNIPIDNYTVNAIATDYNAGSASITVIADSTVSASISLEKQTGNAIVTVNNGIDAIVGASVVLNGETAFTDNMGHALFSNIPVGGYTANVTANLYNSGSANLTITNGNTASSTVTLERQTGNAVITVTDGTNVLPNAIVTLDGSTLPTDNQGIVTFLNMPTGNYSVTVSKENYDINSKVVTITNNATITETISLVRQKGNITLWLFEAKTGGNVALSGVTVTLNGNSVTSDATGKADFTNIPTGSHTVTASKTGFGPGSLDVVVFNGSQLETSISINSKIIVLDRPVGTLTITALRADEVTPLIEGTVLLDVLIKPDGKVDATNYSQSAITDSHGQVTFSGVTTGTHNVLITPKSTLYGHVFTFTLNSTPASLTFSYPWW